MVHEGSSLTVVPSSKLQASWLLPGPLHRKHARASSMVVEGVSVCCHLRMNLSRRQDCPDASFSTSARSCLVSLSSLVVLLELGVGAGCCGATCPGTMGMASQLAAAAAMLPGVKSSYCCDWVDKMAREPGRCMIPMLYIRYIWYTFLVVHWSKKRPPGMPINLAIRTSSVVTDLVRNKELEGILSGTITRHNVVLFFPLMHFWVLFWPHRYSLPWIWIHDEGENVLTATVKVSISQSHFADYWIRCCEISIFDNGWANRQVTQTDY